MNSRSFRKYISNIPGWRTKRKLVVIESDDWGSIRMPNRSARERLIKKGVVHDGNRYNRYDTLATADDLSSLFMVLQKHCDGNGAPAVFTPITITGNPDFERVESAQYSTYFCETFNVTLSRYYSNADKIFELWHEGIR